MATNLNIDDGLIRKAVELGGHKTKKAAVTQALVEYIQQQEQRKILSLSRIRSRAQFDRLTSYLRTFPDTAMITDDDVLSARFFNLCRSKEVQGSNADFLICAAAVRNKFPIFTTDKDFEYFSAHLPIVLYEA